MEIAGDDGRIRTGTVWTGTAHAITSVIGSGVLALPWCVAQLGWIIGPLVLIACAYVTYFTSILLTNCYRTPDPVKGRRNPTYIDVVRAYLGPRDVFVCLSAQYVILWGLMIGYTIVTSKSILALVRSICSRYKGHDASCGLSGNMYIIIFGAVQMLLSQFPNLEKIKLISVVAAVMSFAYSFIGLGLCIAKLASNHSVEGTILGVQVGDGGVTAPAKVWQSFQALGSIAGAYTFSIILIEIQDTMKSPPAENQTMKKVTCYSVGVTTMFYVSIGCVGYAAFGNNIPGIILEGFSEPFWFVGIANIAVIIHLVGAYQVYAQPIYAKYEEWLGTKWPQSAFFHNHYTIPLLFTKSNSFKFTLCKLLLRTFFVIVTTVIAMMLPFFNVILGLLGSIAFWPLTVYFPITIHMIQANITRGDRKWMVLQGLSATAFIVSLVAAVGSIANIVQELKHFDFFKSEL